MYIDTQEGKVDLTVDNFKVVLGMDFVCKVKSILPPFLHSLAILEEETPCIVPIAIEGMPKASLLSTMQVNKGLKKKQVTTQLH